MNPSHEDSVAQLLERVRREQAEGRAWRAREMLQGALRTYHAEPQVLEHYGRLLDDLGDRVEAGKYLFLSEATGSDVDEAIDVFLDRHGRGHPRDLIAQFPRRVRATPLEDFAPRVRQRLEAMGFAGMSAPPNRTFGDAVFPPPTWRQGLGLVGCTVVGLFLLASTVVGAGVILGWLGRLWP